MFTALRLRCAAVAVCVTAVVGGLVGCQKTGIASSVSPCFRILAAAHDAVGGQGSFIDVARVSPSNFPHLGRLGPFVRRRAPSASTTIPSETNVCLVAYKGTFDKTKIPLLRDPQSTGKFAIVVVGLRALTVRAVFLVAALPAPLHSH